MNRVTKAEAKTQRAEWAKAVEEGRVLRIEDGQLFQSFPTIEARNSALETLRANGVAAEVVAVPGTL